MAPQLFVVSYIHTGQRKEGLAGGAESDRLFRSARARLPFTFHSEDVPALSHSCVVCHFVHFLFFVFTLSRTCYVQVELKNEGKKHGVGDETPRI